MVCHNSGRVGYISARTIQAGLDNVIFKVSMHIGLQGRVIVSPTLPECMTPIREDLWYMVNKSDPP